MNDKALYKLAKEITVNADIERLSGVVAAIYFEENTVAIKGSGWSMSEALTDLEREIVKWAKNE